MTSESGRPASTAEAPWSVSKLNTTVKGWIEKLGWLWVEGQLAQINAKPTWKLSYLILRDTQEQVSVQLTVNSALLQGMPTPLKEGDRVVVRGKPAFYAGRGTFSMWVTDIRHVGEGELLARIERLRKQLAAEGLFDPARKKPLPYLPQKIGLITGKASAAERDVISVAQARWPAVQFSIINTPVQGALAVPAVVKALEQLDRDPEVDVIIIARGGGSVEDLLPFSEEALQRAVAAATTPVVSAIGHEPDNPVLDNVADVRAATPTDAAKRVVPDVAQERALVTEARERMAAALRGWVQRERNGLASVRSRPVLADPLSNITRRREEIDRARGLIRKSPRCALRSQRSGRRQRLPAATRSCRFCLATAAGPRWSPASNSPHPARSCASASATGQSPRPEWPLNQQIRRSTPWQKTLSARARPARTPSRTRKN